MEAKTELSNVQSRKTPWLLPLLSSSALFLISGILKAQDSIVNPMLTHADSMRADSTNAAVKKGLHGIDDGGVLTYTLIVVGIIVIIGFAFLTSMRKNKQNPGAPVGYRKPHHHHKHHHKI